MKIDNIKNENEFVYDTDEAAEVVWNNIPKHLQVKYSLEEIWFILETELDYLDSIGLIPGDNEEYPICDYPIDIDQLKMEKHIVDTAIKNDIFLNYDELGDILDAELIYYEMNGALGDIGEYLN
ncbi:MAG: hypothetical protein ACR2KX_06650 [Chitinophagaceae bacterium]